MGGLFAGTTVYADDLKLLTPSVNALNILVDICKNYAAKYNIMFNTMTNMLVIYNCTWGNPPNPNISINNINVKVQHVNEVIQLLVI